MISPDNPYITINKTIACKYCALWQRRPRWMPDYAVVDAEEIMKERECQQNSK